MASTGYNVMHPYGWLVTAGDPTGDANFQVVNGHEGNFFNLNNPGATQAGSGYSGPPAYGVWSPISGMVTTGGADATDAAYYNAALAAPGSQLPVQNSPALVNGNPNLGPVAYSDYATGTLPSQYLSPMPPWKSAPMQVAHQNLPPGAAAAAAAAATAASAPQHSHARTGSGCAGCSGGCGGGKKQCQGRNPPLGLDATNDFLPLYAHPTANAAQSVGAYLYQTTSTKTPAWGTSQGTPADHEIPLQGM